MQFIDLKTQYKSVEEKIDARIKAVLQHGRYIMGPEVTELEARLAEYIGVKHCISCANGTDALTLALMALDIKEGDAVFCPTFTFFASAESIAFSGAEPVFVDSDDSTFNICSSNLEQQIKSVIKEGRLKPKAIMAVDLFGLPANYPEINKLANKYQLKIVEDAAQGFGGSIHGKMAGSFGDIATTSFFPAKPLGCYGDGGAVFTDSDEYAELIKSFRVHGKGKDKYDNIRIGMNSRLDTIQAAILLEKLAQFPRELIQRNSIASNYSEILGDKYLVPIIPENYISSWAQYTIKVDSRDELMAGLDEAGIPSMVYYKKCMHQQSAFLKSTGKMPDFPIADKLAKKVISLPMHPYMMKSDVKRIASECLRLMR